MDPYRCPGRCPTHRGQPRAGCQPCRAWWAWETRTRKRAQREGTYTSGHRDPARTLDHIAALLAAGMSQNDVATRSGVSRRHLWELVNHTPPFVLAATEAAICGVTARPSTRYVDGTGTRRRLQALAVMCHPLVVIAEHLDVTPGRIWILTHRSKTVTPALAGRVSAVYDALSMILGRDHRTGEIARSKRWAPPLAWDDDAIDDPDAKPRMGRITAPLGEYDDARVFRGITGEPSALATQADRHEAIRRLYFDQGVTPADIAGRIAMPQSAVERTVARIQRAAITALAEQGRTPEEIAAELGCSLATVERNLARLRTAELEISDLDGVERGDPPDKIARAA